MNFLKKIILVLLFLFPISNSFGEATLTHVQTVAFDDGDQNGANGSGQNSDADTESKSNDDGGGGFNNSEPMSLTDKNFRENESKLNFDEERDRNPWNKNASSSLDLPIIEEEFFYDDWRKVEDDVKKWRKKVEYNGWGI